MPDKSDTGGQPTMEKLEREGVPIRKCIAMGDSYGGNGGNSTPKASKPKAAPRAGKGRGGY